MCSFRSNTFLPSIIFIALSLSGRAQTQTWTGADPSGFWSAPANWSPAGVPVNGADLVFPGGLPPDDMVSTNDLTASVFRSIRFVQASKHTIRGNPITLTNRADCIINSGTNLIACDLTFSGTPSTPNNQFPSIRGFPGELTVIGNVGGGGLYVFIDRLIIRGQFTGDSIRMQYGSLALYGDNPHPVSVEFLGSSYSTLRVQGSQPNLNITTLWEMESATCPSLILDGEVGDITGCGHITPDSILSVKNLAHYGGWGGLDIRLNGTNVGQYGRLIASGDVNLSMGALIPSAGFNPQPGQVFTIVEKTSPGPIGNAFLGPEGTITTLNGMPCRISYVGGDGNDVTLTAQPANPPLTVNWLSPANGATFQPGATISLRARPDTNRAISVVEFFAGSTNLGRGVLTPNSVYQFLWSNAPAGTFQMHAEAEDNSGARGVSSSVQITVAGGTNPPTPPTITWTGADPSGYWSAPANWSPAGVPVNGADLVFPGALPPADKVSTNDLTDSIFRSIRFDQAGGHTIRGNPMALTNRMDAILSSGGTNLIACDLTFSGTTSTPQYATIRDPTYPGGELTIIGNVSGRSIFVVGLRLTIMGQYTGGNLRTLFTTLTLYGDNPAAISAYIWGSKLIVQGSQPNLDITLAREMETFTSGSLSGTGLIGDVTGFGVIVLDSTLAVRNASAYYLAIYLNGTNPSENGRLVASGDVSPSSGYLSPSAGFNPQPGQVFTIIDKTSPGPIANPVFGPEGSIITLNGMPCRISYVGGDGNDVTLTAVPPRLNIARTPQPANVRLSWSTNYPTFQLQRAQAINGSATWSLHPMSPVVIGSDYTVTQPAATNHEFFRLKQ